MVERSQPFQGKGAEALGRLGEGLLEQTVLGRQDCQALFAFQGGKLLLPLPGRLETGLFQASAAARLASSAACLLCWSAATAGLGENLAGLSARSLEYGVLQTFSRHGSAYH